MKSAIGRRPAASGDDRAPLGPSTDAITTVPVRYTEEGVADLDSVTILPDGPSLPVTTAH